MAYLLDLLKNCNYLCIQGDMYRKVTDICYDSKEVKKGSVFVCLKGYHTITCRKQCTKELLF